MNEIFTKIPEPSSVKAGLESLLSSKVFTVNSVYGLVILAVIVFLAIKFTSKCVGFIVKFLLFWEVMHILGFYTPLGGYVPVVCQLFKMDVLTSLAQLFVNTPVAGCLLWVQAYLTAVIGGAFRVIFYLGREMIQWLGNTMHIA